jgi:hypothetical protein
LRRRAVSAANDNMIVFNLSCDKAHRFEGWFSSADDFTSQAKDGGICCPVCGSAEIERQPSAPYVSKRSAGQTEAAEPQTVVAANAAELLKKKFIEFVLKNTENVGHRFPDEARKIFYKEVPERAIRGTASRAEVSELNEEGIDVVAVPGVPVPPEKLH